jgi:hypothetical protein
LRGIDDDDDEEEEEVLSACPSACFVYVTTHQVTMSFVFGRIN